MSDIGYIIGLGCPGADCSNERDAAASLIKELRAEVAALRQTLVAAETWIHAVPHGDNCYVCNHYEGDPGNQCNCGRESALAMIAASLDAARAALKEPK